MFWFWNTNSPVVRKAQRAKRQSLFFSKAQRSDTTRHLTYTFARDLLEIPKIGDDVYVRRHLRLDLDVDDNLHFAAKKYFSACMPHRTTKLRHFHCILHKKAMKSTRTGWSQCWRFAKVCCLTFRIFSWDALVLCANLSTPTFKLIFTR